MVAAILAISVCMRCSVSVKLEVVVWLVLLSKGAWRGCLVFWFPRGVGLSRSSSMCEMSESAIEEAMSLSASVASWFPPRVLFPFFCLIVPGRFWLKRKVELPGGVEDDLWFWSWAGVASGLFLCVGVKIEGPGPWRWSSLIRISGLRAL
jgi:hypothetical protein